VSRAINVTLSEHSVRSLATDHQASISSIEALPGGGTRVVFTRMADADRMRVIFSGWLVRGTISRTKWASHGH
jgi:hypothetical protein